MVAPRIARPALPQLLCVALLVAFAVSGCNKSGQSESGEAGTEVTPEDSSPSPTPVAPVDLSGPIRLGMVVTEARPGLTSPCTSHHYAERLGTHHLRLRCKTSDPAISRRETFIVLGFLEYDDAPPRLAYYWGEVHVPRHVAWLTWTGELAALTTRMGAPDLGLAPGRAAWSGRAADGAPSSAVLTLETSGGRGVVMVRFHQQTLNEALR